MRPGSVGASLGVIFAVLFVLALGLFAAPLFALAIAVLFAAGAAAWQLLRRAGRGVSEPGSPRGDAVTPEGKPTTPTGRASGAPASGEG